jgi:hypothetical protein
VRANEFINEETVDWGRLTTANQNLIIDKAKVKPDGIYSVRGILFRVCNGKVTHFASEGKILMAVGHFNTSVGQYEVGMGSQDRAKKILKAIK